MIALDALKGAAIVFGVSIAQVSIFSSVAVLGGRPDVLLVTLVCVALLRGSVFGALAGFGAGLVVDIATLETLGVTSLLLTVAGYWIGRYGETTGRERAHAPFSSIAVISVLYSAGALGLNFLLQAPAPARHVLLETLPQAILLNLVLTIPVYALCRWALRPEPAGGRRAQEVSLLG